MKLIVSHPSRNKEIRSVSKQLTLSMAVTMLISLVAIVVDIDTTSNLMIVWLIISVSTFATVRLLEVIWLVHEIAAIIMTSASR